MRMMGGKNTFRLILCMCTRYGRLYCQKSTNLSANYSIDFIVTLKSNDPIKYGENYFALKESLQNILSRNVDLLEFKALKEGKFLNLIDSQKQLVYEGAS